MKILENRIPPPLLFMAIAVAMWFVSRDQPQLLPGGHWSLGFTIVLVTLALWMGGPAIRAFRSAKTTINPIQIDQVSTLVTTGVFGISRNPMYVSLSLLLIAWMVQLGTAWAALGPVFFVVFITRFQIIPEERALIGLFGKTYTDYQSRVRRWL